MKQTADIIPLLIPFTRWASRHDQILAVALVGSYARDQARDDSDVDLVVLTSNPLSFHQQTDWVQSLPWDHLQISKWADEDYGLLWSRRLYLNTGLEIEIGFAAPKWASLHPLDEGTRQVIHDGCWILFDPTGILNRLVRAIAQQE
jgi:hypothetical protein